MVATPETLQHGLRPIHLGKSKTDKPVIEHGFLIFEDLKGCLTGINLSEVSIFSIEPEYEE